MRRSWVVTLSLSVITVTGLTSAVLGQPRIVQTGCDTLSLAPPLVRVQFRVVNLGERPICAIFMVPLHPTPPDTCSPPILQCDSPPEWFCWADGSAFWEASLGPGGQCISPDAALDSFAIAVTDLSFCCYGVVFYGAGIPEPYYGDTFCFGCDQPVPARPSTWGKLKLLYR